MDIPIFTRRRKAVETAAIAKTLRAVDTSLVESGVIAKSFLNGNAATQLSSKGQPGIPNMQPGTSWSNTGGTQSRLVARVNQNLSSGFNKPSDELELALAEQGLSWGPPFPPGRPLDPFWGVRRAPRTFDYPVGSNVQLTPRWNRLSFPTIKAIYDAYDVAQICVRHLINDVRSLEFNWEPLKGEQDDVSDDLKAAKAFWALPDKRQPFRAWLAEWLQDVLRYDAGSLYIRRNNAGEPIAIEVIDGTTIIPLVDFYGRRPEDEQDENAGPEDLFGGEIVPAYLQIIEGLPWDWLAADDIIYQPWNPLPESQYGLAPLEAVLLSANTDIRFQWHFLQFFTDGTLPAGFMEAPPDMSDPAQITDWENSWNAIMQGDQAMNRKIRWVPAGAKFTSSKPDADKFSSDFVLYLARRTMASFGVTPNDLGFTEDVNRSTGDTQIDVQFRVGTSPLIRHAEDVINLITQQHLKLRCAIHFDDGKETEDRVATATAAGIDIDHGVMSIDERRQDLGLPVDKGKPSPRYINNTRSGPIPLLALESAAGEIDADTYGRADSQELINTPYVPPPGPIAPAGSPEQKAAGEATAQEYRDMVGITSEEPPSSADETTQGEGEEETMPDALKESFWHIARMLNKSSPGITGEGKQSATPDNTGGPGLNKGVAATTIVGGTDGITVPTGIQGKDLEDDDEDDEEETAVKAGQVALSLRRWRSNSRNRLRKGMAPKEFIDPNLPSNIYNEVWVKLQKAGTREEVDAAFASVGKKASAGDGPANLGGTPGFHRNTDAIVDHYTPLIAKGLGSLYSSDAISAAIKAAEGAKEKAKKDAIHEPPNLHSASNPTAESCGNCMMFQGGQCWGYGGWRVEGNQVCDSWEQSQESIATKAAEPDPAAKAAMDALRAAAANPAELEKVLHALSGDAFLQGAHEAAQAAGGSVVASLAGVTGMPDDYWDKWTPGYGEAAANAADGGMRAMLDKVDLTISGATDTTIDRIGNIVAEGLNKGDSIQSTGKAVRDVIEDPARAEMIANTETARAMTTASVQTYESAGIEEVNWLAEADACPECEANADASPYPLEGGEEPPQHPNCRCALSPVVNLEAPAETALTQEGE